MDLAQLRRMATDPNDVVTVSDFNVLQNELQRLVDITCRTDVVERVQAQGIFLYIPIIYVVFKVGNYVANFIV